MTLAEAVALVAAGTAAGIVSTVASLASVVSYPVLLAIGLPPLSANVTNTVSLVFTAPGAALGSRPELAGEGRRVLRLGLVTAAGGAAGAALLLTTGARAFEAAAPVLIGLASVVLLVQPQRRVLAGHQAGERSPLLLAGLFAVAVYVGYFGAAGGILLLAILTAMLTQSLARTNAVKNVINGFANGVAALGFAVFGPVDWAVVGPLAAGFLAGGWLGPKVVRRLPGQALRYLVGAAGLAVAAWLGYQAYR
ncbi:MAG: sulfite exporter TauE/SafE family protein [Gemmatimonadota bacterium]